VSIVVVTGASGFVGQRVVARLAHRADVDRVIGVDVVPSPTAGPAVEHLVLDLARDVGGSADRLWATLAGADSIIHLAWSHGEPGWSSERAGVAMGSANLVALRRVLDAASRVGVSSLVHISSATVYGAWPDNPVPLPEDAAIRPNPGFAFAVEKGEAERLVGDWAALHPSTSVTVLRPAVTLGASGPALYRALAGTRAPRPGDVGRPGQFLHVDDLAAAVVFAWERRLAGVYNVAPDGWLGEDAARDLAGGVARVTLPGVVVRTLSSWGWRILRAGAPREALPYSVHPWVVANDRLRAAGWVPEHTNEEALVATDDRSHWGDLPPGRRQQVALVAAGAGALAAGATAIGVSTALAARLRRSRRRPPG
jgi:nucleoside-diphosphate-sugar epimerase